MDLFKKISDEMAQQQGFIAATKGAPPRIFLSEGEHKAAYYRGYEMGKGAIVNRVLDKLSKKFLE